MIFRPFGLLVALCASLALSGTPANAHPHVWVKVNSELVYAPDGTVTGVRHVWTFDDMFSTYAVQGIEAKQKGVFTREQLAPVAEENVSSMKELEYFTFAKADGKKTKFRDPVDYWLEFKDEMLTRFSIQSFLSTSSWRRAIRSSSRARHPLASSPSPGGRILRHRCKASA
jgi:ABC-type uncharacterized transport system substrate-binding protein